MTSPARVATVLTLGALFLSVAACGRSEPVAEASADESGPAAVEPAAGGEETADLDMVPQVEAGVAADGIETLGIPNLHTPEPGLATGGQITPEQMDTLHDMGFGLFVSLRPTSEEGAGWEEAHAGEAGIQFVRIPVAGRDDLSEENARLLADVLAGSGPDSPALVYCKSGNRVGALLALKEAWVDHLDPEAAIEYGRDAGMTRLEGTVEEILGR